ncbi:MAG: hypothetical protein E7037_07610 [Verrucomicrobia bacterium]|nr:hypothetical protein [Verrucomicrobiota bacterium]
MNKKQLLAFSFTALFAASAMGTEIPSIPEGYENWSSNTTSTTEANKYISGSIKQDTNGKNVYGGTENTVLNATLGSSGFLGIGAKPVVFRGALLGLATDETKTQDSYVWINGGTYTDKVSAVDNTLNKITYNGAVNLNTGHMYISGGTFNSDITGLGMAQSGTHTANTDIHILGKISNGLGMGVFGGVSGASGGCASLVGNTSVTVGNGGDTSFIAGGNRMAANLTGSISLCVESGGSVGGILGGNYVHDTLSSTSTIDGDISINVSGTVQVKTSWLSNNVINGIIGGGANTNVTGTTNITINDTADVSGGIAGGSAGHTEGVRVENSKITINGGTIKATGSQKYVGIVEVDNAIVGGNIALGVQQAASYTMGTSEISISGGTITGDIYGGGIAQGNNYVASSTVESASITIDATNAVSISGNIYGGGRADTAKSTATVATANVTFTGAGSNLTFTGTVSGDGSGAGTSATGTSTFTFDGYTGVFAGTIANFDELVVKNASAVTGANDGIVKIENVGKVSLKDTSTLKLETAVSSGNNLEISGGSLSEGSSVTLTTNASVTVKASDTISVTLTSSAEGVVVNKAEQIATSDVEISVEGVVVENVLAAWSFEVENGGSGVTVTMDVGENVDVSTIKIFHREDSNSAWEDYTDIVSDITLVDGKLTFTATSFSDYTAVETVAAPEPSAFGLLAGLGALALVASRRRRK